MGALGDGGGKLLVGGLDSGGTGDLYGGMVGGIEGESGGWLFGGGVVGVLEGGGRELDGCGGVA